MNYGHISLNWSDVKTIATNFYLSLSFNCQIVRRQETDDEAKKSTLPGIGSCGIPAGMSNNDLIESSIFP